MVKRKAEEQDDAPVSAFAALKATINPSRPDADAPTTEETGTSPPVRVGDEVSRPAKKRTGRKWPKGRILPITQSPSGHQDTPLGYRSQIEESEKKDEDPDTRQENFLDAATEVAGDPSLSADLIAPEYNCSDSEASISYTGPVQQLSTFTPTKDNVVGEDLGEWTIRLDETDKLTLLGQYDIWVRKGAVVVMGAVMHAGSSIHRVHAPSTHSLPVIRACQNPFMPQNQTAEITILSIANPGIRQLRKLSPQFARIWNHRSLSIGESLQTTNILHRSYVFLKTSADDLHHRPLYPVEYSVYWQSEIDRLRNPFRKQPPAVMVCGLKGTGKSTFCRVLANSMLSVRGNLRKESYGFVQRDHLGANGIAFLDLDPGQPEFSPPGEVTLMYMRQFNLGVPYTHPAIGLSQPNRVIRAHHIGAVSAQDNPDHYCKCALDLFRRYRILLSQDPSCPLIINYSGWVTATGLEVLVELIKRMSLTDIVYTNKMGPAEVAGTLSETARAAGITFQSLVSLQPPVFTKAASDFRMMQALSYFHLAEPEGIHLGWNSSPLHEVAPLAVRYSGASQDIFAVMILGEEQDPELYGDLLEGSIVGVVVLEDDTAIIGLQDEGQAGGARVVSVDHNSSIIGFGADGHHLPPADDGGNEDHSEEHTNGRPFELRHAPEIDSSGDEESHDDEMAGSDGSGFRLPSRRPTGKLPPSTALPSQATPLSYAAVHHPLVSRTPEGLPYLYTGAAIGVQPALDPSKCYSLGQALIRAVDRASQMIHLFTPIPTSTLQTLARQQSKIVLVRGALDMPTWAFFEEYAVMVSQRRRRGSAGGPGKREKVGEWEMKEWADRTPWAEFRDWREEKSSAKVRHARRNLRTG